jgi:triphosphoribosyl-dephospho-CoA synthase
LSVLSPGAVATAFVEACHDELAALKPGNVHVHADGHGMSVADFESAAQAAAPAIADAGLRVGERIRQAVEASLARTGCNTNLGIVLLCAPLAAAAQRREGSDLRSRLAAVLDDLDRADASAAFAAIVAANPAGLGRVPEQDVAHVPSMGLLQAMALAADRDRIARAYQTGFAEVFEIALPALRDARRLGGTPPFAVSRLHMQLLALDRDSHICRKHGQATAEQVRLQAGQSLARIDWNNQAQTLAALAGLDADLKRRGLNPGTTADLVVATLFADRLETGLHVVRDVSLQ